MSDEAVATTQRRVYRRVGIPAADRTCLTSDRWRRTTTTLPARHVLELRNGSMRIPASSDRLRRSVVAGLCPGYRRCRHRPRSRYPRSRPSRYQASGSRASRGTEYRTRTPGRRWAWRWAWTTLVPGKRPLEQFQNAHSALDRGDDGTIRQSNSMKEKQQCYCRHDVLGTGQ